MHRGDAGANLNFFKFEIGNTGFIRRNWVTWCPDEQVWLVERWNHSIQCAQDGSGNASEDG
jgi:hypothetical protein